MFRAVSNEWKKFNTNFETWLKMISDETLYLENTWRMNRYARTVEVMILCIEIKITYLVSQLMITRIVSNSNDDRSFSIKSMKMKFYKCSEMRSYLKDL